MEILRITLPSCSRLCSSQKMSAPSVKTCDHKLTVHEHTRVAVRTGPVFSAVDKPVRNLAVTL
eukprot:6203383-Pleurochrysis_carterae.AAC.1